MISIFRRNSFFDIVGGNSQKGMWIKILLECIFSCRNSENLFGFCILLLVYEEKKKNEVVFYGRIPIKYFINA